MGVSMHSSHHIPQDQGTNRLTGLQPGFFGARGQFSNVATASASREDTEARFIPCEL